MSTRHAFDTDDQADQYLASDGVSRYGAYVNQKRQDFYPSGFDHEPTCDPIEFALAAWSIAGPPTMSPGYVIWHPRIQDAAAHWDDEHRAALAVDIAVPAPPVSAALPSAWREWECQCWPPRWHDPFDNDRVTVLTTLTVRVPLDPRQLPRPQYLSGIPCTDTAKQAVTAMCTALNAQLDELLIALDTHGEGDSHRPFEMNLR